MSRMVALPGIPLSIDLDVLDEAAAQALWPDPDAPGVSVKAWPQFDPTKHPRHPKGRREGGRFASKIGEGSALSGPRQAAPYPTLDAEPATGGPAFAGTLDELAGQLRHGQIVDAPSLRAALLTVGVAEGWTSFDQAWSRALSVGLLQAMRVANVGSQTALLGWLITAWPAGATVETLRPIINGGGDVAIWRLLGAGDAEDAPAIVVENTLRSTGDGQVTIARLIDAVEQDAELAGLLVRKTLRTLHRRGLAFSFDEYVSAVEAVRGKVFHEYRPNLQPYLDDFAADLAIASGLISLEEIQATLLRHNWPHLLPTEFVKAIGPRLQSVSPVWALTYALDHQRLQSLAEIEAMGPALRAALGQATFEDLRQVPRSAHDLEPAKIETPELAERLARNSQIESAADAERLLFTYDKQGWRSLTDLAERMGPQGWHAVLKEANPTLDQMLDYGRTFYEKAQVSPPGRILAQLRAEGVTWSQIEAVLEQHGGKGMRYLGADLIASLLMADPAGVPPAELVHQVSRLPDFLADAFADLPAIQAWNRSTVDYGTGEPVTVDVAAQAQMGRYFEEVYQGRLKPGFVDGQGNVWRAGAQKDAICDQISTAAGVGYDDVNALLESWASSSNDGLGALVQVAAAESFDAGLSGWQLFDAKVQGKAKRSVTEKGIGRKVTKAVLRAMQQRTQEWLQAAGAPAMVRLYRGVRLPENEVSRFKVGDIWRHTDNALSSWALDRVNASRFARSEKGLRGIVLSALIPAERILSTARTGFGCLTENEFVVLGSQDVRYGRVEELDIEGRGSLFRWGELPDYLEPFAPVKAWPGVAWQEQQHPRHPRGTRRGGKFAPKARPEGTQPVEKSAESSADSSRQAPPPGLAQWPRAEEIQDTWPFRAHSPDGIGPARLLDTLTPETDVERWYVGEDPLVRESDAEHEPGTQFTPTFDQAIITRRKRRAAKRLAAAIGVSEAEASAFLRVWADTANDTDLRALSIQEAAAGLFGTRLSDWQQGRLEKAQAEREAFLENFAAKQGASLDDPFIAEKARRFADAKTHGRLALPFQVTYHYPPTPQVRSDAEALDLTRRAVQAIYDMTQANLAAAGVESVVAYRGFWGLTLQEAQETKIGDWVEMPDNVLSSWSLHPDVAHAFAAGRYATPEDYPAEDTDPYWDEHEVNVVLKARIPSALIFATPRSGFGCLPEWELVVGHGGNWPGRATVEELYWSGSPMVEAWQEATGETQNEAIKLWIDPGSWPDDFDPDTEEDWEPSSKAWPAFDPQRHPRHPKGDKRGGKFRSTYRQAAPPLPPAECSADELIHALWQDQVDLDDYLAWASAWDSRMHSKEESGALSYVRGYAVNLRSMLDRAGVRTVGDYLSHRQLYDTRRREHLPISSAFEPLDKEALRAFDLTWDELAAFLRGTGMRLYEVPEAVLARAVQGRSLDDVFRVLAETERYQGEIGIGGHLGERAYETIVNAVAKITPEDAIWLAFDNPYVWTLDEKLDYLPERIRGRFQAWLREAIDYRNGQTIPWPAEVEARVEQALLPDKEQKWDKGRAALKDQVVRRLAAETELPYDEVDALVRQWALTSNGLDMRALGIQETASAEFWAPLSVWQTMRLEQARRPDNLIPDWDLPVGADPTARQRYLYEPATGANDETAAAARAKIRKILRTMYWDTQMFFKAHGITHVRVYRGLFAHQPPTVRPGEIVQLEDNAVSSWSTHFTDAERFARSHSNQGWQPYGLIVSTTVPVERILSTAQTGLGCANEVEVVVLAIVTPTYGRVEYVRNLPRPELAAVVEQAAAEVGLPAPWTKKFPADTTATYAPPVKAWPRSPSAPLRSARVQRTWRDWQEQEHPRHPKGTRRGGKFAPKWGARQAAPSTSEMLLAKPDLSLADIRQAVADYRITFDFALQRLLPRVAQIEGWSGRFDEAVTRIEQADFYILNHLGVAPASWLSLIRLFPEGATIREARRLPARLTALLPDDVEGAAILLDNTLAAMEQNPAFGQMYPEVKKMGLGALFAVGFRDVTRELMTPEVIEKLSERRTVTFDDYLDVLENQANSWIRLEHLKMPLFGKLAAGAGFTSLEQFEHTIGKTMRNGPRFLPIPLLQAVVPTLRKVEPGTAVKYAVEAQVDLDTLEGLGEPMRVALDQVDLELLRRQWESFYRSNGIQLRNGALAVRAARASGVTTAKELEQQLFRLGLDGLMPTELARAFGPHGLQALFTAYRPPLDAMLRYGKALSAAGGYSPPGALAFDVTGLPWREVRAALDRTGVRLEDLGADMLDALSMADLTTLTWPEARYLLDADVHRSNINLLHAPVVEDFRSRSVDYNSGAALPVEFSQEAVVALFQQHQGRQRLDLKNADEQQKDAIAYRLSQAVKMRIDDAAAVVAWWAGDANKGSSALLQKAADEIFNAGLSDWQQRELTNSLANRTKLMERVRPKLAAMLEEMDETTRRWLAQTGATHVRLYRGVNLPRAEAETLNTGDSFAHTDNALSSWSLDIHTAERFADANNPAQVGVVLSALVPVDRILCNARTGFGCLDEQEFVVIGRPENSHARVEKVRGRAVYRRSLLGLTPYDVAAGQTGIKAWGDVWSPEKHPRYPKGTRWQRRGAAPGRFAARQGLPVRVDLAPIAPVTGETYPYPDTGAQGLDVARLRREGRPQTPVERWFVAGDTLLDHIEPAALFPEVFAYHFYRPTFDFEDVARRYDAAVQALAQRTGLDYGEIGDQVSQWLRTSNGSDLRSLALQQAAAEVMRERTGRPFALSPWQQARVVSVLAERKARLAMGQKVADLPVHLRYPFEPPARAGEPWRTPEEAQAATRRVAAAIYDLTQEQLAAAGITRVVAYRGIKRRKPLSKIGETVAVSDNVLASWSLRRDVGAAFADLNAHPPQNPEPGYGYLLKAEIPAERIFGTSLSGLGSAPEWELVVLGGDGAGQATIADISLDGQAVVPAEQAKGRSTRQILGKWFSPAAFGLAAAQPRQAAPGSDLPSLRPTHTVFLPDPVPGSLHDPASAIHRYYTADNAVQLRQGYVGWDPDQQVRLKQANAEWLAAAVGTTPERASAFIGHWAGGHSNTWLSTLIIQQEAARLFGVPFTRYQRRQMAKTQQVAAEKRQASAWLPEEARLPFGLGLPGDPDEATARDMTRRALQAMYERTQRELAAAGVDEVVAWRGAVLPREQLVGVQRGGTWALRSNALSSWSLHWAGPRWYANPGDAEAKTQAGVVISAHIPRERILATPWTGFGALPDAEVVVIGGRDDRVDVDWLYNAYKEPVERLPQTAAHQAAPASESGEGSAAFGEAQPMWRPVMSRAEAEAWVQDSAVRQDLYHVTFTSSMDAIKALDSAKSAGFDLNRRRFGRMWGDGIYLATNQKDADIWLKMLEQARLVFQAREGQKLGGSVRMTLKARVQRPLLVDLTRLLPWMQEKAAPESVIAHFAPGFDKAYAAILDATLRQMPVAGGRRPQSRLTTALQKLGYDSIWIKASHWSRETGGDQLVVFDPHAVTVIQDEEAA